MAKRNNAKKQVGPLILARGMPERRQLWFLLWHLGLLLLACGALTVFTLRLSYSNLNPEIWLGFWEDLWIPLINLALVYGFCLVLFALLGRAWLAFLLTALVWLGVAIGNYYLIIIRTDPLQFQDLSCLREALAITGTQGYELELSAPILVSVGGALGLTALLALLSRWHPRWRKTRWLALAAAVGLFTGASLVGNSWAMLNLTQNYSHINTWSSTQIYVSRGVVYSFYRTVFTGSGKPDGYSEQDTKALLESYREQALPEERKVDLFVVMRESYADLSELDCDDRALDVTSPYAAYHAFVNESVLMGNLVTNGFGGDTKNAERCFLTGYYTPRDWRKPTNSYVWYLRQEGYRTEGAHPFNGWFYNRLNVDRYLGFQSYCFREDTFDALVGEQTIANDDVLYDVIWDQYQEHLQQNGGPYFNFSVTYEGHGPYNYSKNLYAGRYVQKDANSADGYAMNNYLGCCAKRDQELAVLVDRFRACERPIVLLTYGDHKATLGKDVNNYTTAAYQHYGMDLDLATAEGFFNYYSTDYVIWMNDAARRTLGYTGKTLEQGPTISPCYLMNVLFDALGWGKGPAALQAMGELMQAFPVYSTKGRVSIEGELVTGIPQSWLAQYRQVQALSYYRQHHFSYEALARESGE